MAKTKKEKTTSTDIAEMLSDIFQVGFTEEEIEYKFIPTQYKNLNEYVMGIGGFPRGRMVELSGTTNIGKTRLMSNLTAYWQKQGLKILWVPAEALDLKYFASIGNDISPNCENPITRLEFTHGGDMAIKIKLALALDLYDVIVIDSMQAVNPPKIMNAEGQINMNDELSVPLFWKNFLRDLEGGFQVTFNKKLVQSSKVYKEFIDGKLVDNKFIHKIEDKKACVILLNHLELDMANATQYYKPQKTSGGNKKDYRFSHRLWMNVGKTEKDDDTKEILWTDVKISSKKSKMGAPSGRTCILRSMGDSGLFVDMNTIEDIEVYDE